MVPFGFILMRICIQPFVLIPGSIFLSPFGFILACIYMQTFLLIPGSTCLLSFPLVPFPSTFTRTFISMLFFCVPVLALILLFFIICDFVLI